MPQTEKLKTGSKIMATATKHQTQADYQHSDLKETKERVLTDTWDEWVQKDTVVDRMFFGGIGR